MARDKTPDLMGDLLSGKKPASKPAEQQASQEASQPAPGPADEIKIKRTFYLSREGLRALDDLQYQLRRMASPEDRASISYSSIVQEAILLALADLQAKGEGSSLAKRLAE